mgnify:FL=1
MLGRPRATIQPVENGNLGERYPSLVLQPPINARRKPRQKDKCSSRIRIVAKDEVEAEEVDSTYLTKGIHNFGKKTEAIEEPSQEGGASTSNKVGERRHLRATIAAKLGIAKRCAKKDEANRLQQADNSQITPRTRNTTDSSL